MPDRCPRTRLCSIRVAGARSAAGSALPERFATGVATNHAVARRSKSSAQALRPRWRRWSLGLSGPTAARLFRRPSEISSACRADHVAVAIDGPTAQERGLYARCQLLSFERRVALRGLRIGGADDERLVRVHEHEVRVEARSDIALGEQPVAPRRVPGKQLGHVIVAHAALASLAQHPGEQVLGAAEAGLR